MANKCSLTRYAQMSTSFSICDSIFAHTSPFLPLESQVISNKQIVIALNQQSHI